jgi:predicted  nucleic acid-binding Zn-ribbon protein
VRAYQDIAVDLAMVKASALGAYERIKDIRVQIEDFKYAVLDRFERQDRHFDTQEAHFEMHGKRFDALDQRLDAHDKRFDTLEQKADGLSDRFDRLEKLLLDRLPPA